MSNRLRLLGASLAVFLFWAGPTRAQQPASAPAAHNVAEVKFTTFPGLPTCSTGAVQTGDPSKGAAIILIKAAAGCAVPWHWHTPNENLMIVSGTGILEMKDGKPATLRPGGYAMMPSHHVHQFRATTACTFFLYTDGAMDIHYVNPQGKELTPADAIKAVKETVATEMK